MGVSPPPVSILFFETGSPIEPGAHHFGQQALNILLALPSPCQHCRHAFPHLACFYLCSGTLNSDLPSHLCSPIERFLKNHSQLLSHIKINNTWQQQMGIFISNASSLCPITRSAFLLVARLSVSHIMWDQRVGVAQAIRSGQGPWE